MPKKKKTKLNGARHVYARVRRALEVPTKATQVLEKAIASPPAAQVYIPKTALRPSPKFEIGWLVSSRVSHSGSSNVRIVGLEWGGDNKNMSHREEWFYWIVNDGGLGAPIFVSEDQIVGRIN